MYITVGEFFLFQFLQLNGLSEIFRVRNIHSEFSKLLIYIFLKLIIFHASKKYLNISFLLNTKELEQARGRERNKEQQKETYTKKHTQTLDTYRKTKENTTMNNVVLIFDDKPARLLLLIQSSTLSLNSMTSVRNILSDTERTKIERNQKLVYLFFNLLLLICSWL